MIVLYCNGGSTFWPIIVNVICELKLSANKLLLFKLSCDTGNKFHKHRQLKRKVSCWPFMKPYKKIGVCVVVSEED